MQQLTRTCIRSERFTKLTPEDPPPWALREIVLDLYIAWSICGVKRDVRKLGTNDGAGSTLGRQDWSVPVGFQKMQASHLNHKAVIYTKVRKFLSVPLDRRVGTAQPISNNRLTPLTLFHGRKECHSEPGHDKPELLNQAARGAAPARLRSKSGSTVRTGRLHPKAPAGHP